MDKLQEIVGRGHDNLNDKLDKVIEDILSISDIINTAEAFGESIDLSLLNTKLHEMYCFILDNDCDRFL
jgi:hypothetical protein